MIDLGPLLRTLETKQAAIARGVTLPRHLPDGSDVTSIEQVAALLGVHPDTASAIVMHKAAQGQFFVETKMVPPDTDDFDGAYLMLLPTEEQQIWIGGVGEFATPVEDRHVTLAAFETDKITKDEFETLARDIAKMYAPIEARIGGITRFKGGERDPLVINIDSAPLEDVRAWVLASVGNKMNREHGYTPHMTIGYLDPKEPIPYHSIDQHTDRLTGGDGEITPLTLTRLMVSWNGDSHIIDLEGDRSSFMSGEEKSLETKRGPRRVRTPEGVRMYGQPIGTIITRDMIERAKRLIRSGEAPEGSQSRRSGRGGSGTPGDAERPSVRRTGADSRLPGPDDAEKIRNAERMFGTGSPQHQQAQRRFGGDEPQSQRQSPPQQARGRSVMREGAGPDEDPILIARRNREKRQADAYVEKLIQQAQRDAAVREKIKNRPESRSGEVTNAASETTLNPRSPVADMDAEYAAADPQLRSFIRSTLKRRAARGESEAQEWVAEHGNDTDQPSNAPDVSESTPEQDAANEEANESYHGGHQPPDPFEYPDEPVASADRLDDDMPDVYENPRLYWGNDEFARESIAALRKVRGKPDATMKIYRAVPANVDRIERGNWVTPSRAYAQQHIDSNGESDWKILEEDVRAGDVYFGGNDFVELGYWPQQQERRNAAELPDNEIDAETIDANNRRLFPQPIRGNKLLQGVDTSTLIGLSRRQDAAESERHQDTLNELAWRSQHQHDAAARDYLAEYTLGSDDDSGTTERESTRDLIGRIDDLEGEERDEALFELRNRLEGEADYEAGVYLTDHMDDYDRMQELALQRYPGAKYKREMVQTRSIVPTHIKADTHSLKHEWLASGDPDGRIAQEALKDLSFRAGTGDQVAVQLFRDLATGKIWPRNTENGYPDINNGVARGEDPETRRMATAQLSRAWMLAPGGTKIQTLPDVYRELKYRAYFDEPTRKMLLGGLDQDHGITDNDLIPSPMPNASFQDISTSDLIDQNPLDPYGGNVSPALVGELAWRGIFNEDQEAWDILNNYTAPLRTSNKHGESLPSPIADDVQQHSVNDLMSVYRSTMTSPREKRRMAAILVRRALDGDSEAWQAVLRVKESFGKDEVRRQPRQQTRPSHIKPDGWSSSNTTPDLTVEDLDNAITGAFSGYTNTPVSMFLGGVPVRFTRDGLGVRASIDLMDEGRGSVVYPYINNFDLDLPEDRADFVAHVNGMRYATSSVSSPASSDWEFTDAMLADLQFIDTKRPGEPLEIAYLGDLRIVRKGNFGGDGQVYEIYTRSGIVGRQTSDLTMYVPAINRHLHQGGIKRVQGRGGVESFWDYDEGTYGRDFLMEDEPVWDEGDWDDPDYRKMMAADESARLGIYFGSTMMSYDVELHERVNRSARAYEAMYPGYTEILGSYHVKSSGGRGEIASNGTSYQASRQAWMNFTTNNFARGKSDALLNTLRTQDKAGTGHFALSSLSKVAEDTGQSELDVATAYIMNHEHGHTVARAIFGQFIPPLDDPSAVHYTDDVEVTQAQAAQRRRWHDAFDPILEKFGVLQPDQSGAFRRRRVETYGATTKDIAFLDKARLRELLSGYGTTNYHEMMAETWGAYQTDTNPTEFVLEMGQAMEALFIEWLDGVRAEDVAISDNLWDPSRAAPGRQTQPTYTVGGKKRPVRR